MKQGKRFIAPGTWFAMTYPADWVEAEGEEGTFLFYNPEHWTGNLRLSAYRGPTMGYGRQAVREELRTNPSAQAVRLGTLDCAYSREMMQEGGDWYTSHLWVVALGDMAVECTFTVARGMPVDEAEGVIASLEPRRPGTRYPAEVIPIRLSEIAAIDEAYDWTKAAVKEALRRDLQGEEEDIELMQQLADSGRLNPKKREPWTALGITLCTLIANGLDGWEWRTLVDGNREVPVLEQTGTGRIVDPMKLVWSRVKAGEPVRLAEAFDTAIDGEAEPGG